MNKKNMLVSIIVMFFCLTQFLPACCFKNITGQVWSCHEVSLAAACGIVRCNTKDDSCLAPVLPKTICCIAPSILIVCCCDCFGEDASAEEHHARLAEKNKYDLKTPLMQRGSSVGSSRESSSNIGKTLLSAQIQPKLDQLRNPQASTMHTDKELTL